MNSKNKQRGENGMIEQEKIDMVIMSNHPDGYFALNFDKKTIREVTFEEAFGHDFFDWHLGIAMMSDYNKQMYDLARGKDGCGLHKFFSVRDDLHKARLREYKEFERVIKLNTQKLNNSAEVREDGE